MSGKREMSNLLRGQLKGGILGLSIVGIGVICFFSVTDTLGILIGIAGVVFLAMCLKINIKSRMVLAKFDEKERLYEMLESGNRTTYDKMSVILLDEYVIDYRTGLNIIKRSDIVNVSKYKDSATVAHGVWVILKLKNGENHRLLSMGLSAEPDDATRFIQELGAKR